MHRSGFVTSKNIVQSLELRCFCPPRCRLPSAKAAALRSDLPYQSPSAAAAGESFPHRDAENSAPAALRRAAQAAAVAAVVQAERAVSDGLVPAPACGGGSRRAVECSGYTSCSPA